LRVKKQEQGQADRGRDRPLGLGHFSISLGSHAQIGPRAAAYGAGDAQARAFSAPLRERAPQFRTYVVKQAKEQVLLD